MKEVDYDRGIGPDFLSRISCDIMLVFDSAPCGNKADRRISLGHVSAPVDGNTTRAQAAGCWNLPHYWLWNTLDISEIRIRLQVVASREERSPADAFGLDEGDAISRSLSQGHKQRGYVA